MYKGLTAKTPGCVALASRCSAGTFVSGDSSVFPILHSQRSARLTRSDGFEPERRAVPGYHLVPGTAFSTRFDRLSGLWARYAMAGERLGAASGLQQQTRRRPCRPHVPDGPTLDAPEYVADHDPRKKRAGAERKLHPSFRSPGIPVGPAPRVAFRPSPHPRIRWTVASPGGAIRARRHTRPPPSRVPKCPTKC
jgi:hypothetical protein